MSRTAKPWYNRERGCWMVWWNGRRVRLAEGTKNRDTKKAAEEKFADLRHEARHNPQPGAPQTVASIIEAYEASARKRLAQSTIDAGFPYLQSFAEAHGWRSVASATPEHLQDWLADHPEWASDWTKNFAVRQVKTAFNWATFTAKTISHNPFQGFNHGPGMPRRDMTADEFQAILRSTPNRQHRKKPSPGARFRQVMIYLWFTGSRPSEAAKLRWANVDFQKAQVVLQQHKTARSQKTPEPRIIPLHPVVMRLLQWISRLNQPGEYVFLNHRRKPWNKNTLGQRVKRAREVAGVADDAKLYGVRHAFGTRAIVEGKLDLKTTSELLGHTTTRMTEHYLHLAGKREHLAAAMLRVTAPRRGSGTGQASEHAPPPPPADNGTGTSRDTLPIAAHRPGRSRRA